MKATALYRFVLIASTFFFILNNLEAQDPVIKFSSSCRFQCSMKSRNELEKIISRFRDFDSAYNTIVRYFNSEKNDAFVLIGRNCPGIRIKQYPTDSHPNKQDRGLGTSVIPWDSYNAAGTFSVKVRVGDILPMKALDHSSSIIARLFSYTQTSPFDPSKLNILLWDSFELDKRSSCFYSYNARVHTGTYIMGEQRTKYILELHNRDTIMQKDFEVYNDGYNSISLYELVSSCSIASKRNKLSLYMYDTCTLDKIPVFSNCLIEFADENKRNEVAAFIGQYHKELDEHVFYLLCRELLIDVFGTANFVNLDAWIREVLSKK